MRTITLSLILTAAVAAGQTTPPASAAPTAPPPGCTAPLNRQFDFWIGQWDVVSPDGKFAGTNRIDLVDRGCALHENWSSSQGRYTGQSLNAVGPDGKWHQTWVDSARGRLELIGGLQGPNMVLEGENPSVDGKAPPTRNRIIWTPENPNLVRQHWETSTDLGKTWTTAFDGRYHRVPGPATAGESSFLTRLEGGWIGTGKFQGLDTHVELQVERWLGRPLFRLNWKNVVTSDPRAPFEGNAVYEEKGNGEFSATWWDTHGSKYAILATAADQSMTTHWGDSGRTVYTFLPAGDLEVVDTMKKPDGSWAEFARSTLKRK